MMLDERKIYQLVSEISGIQWSPGFPGSFASLANDEIVGCWALRNNANAESTSTRREYLTKVSLQIQLWAASPERRMAGDQLVDTNLGQIFQRVSGGHVEEVLPDMTKAFRSILIFEGRVDSETLHVYQ